MKILLALSVGCLLSLAASPADAQKAEPQRGWVERDSQERRIGTAEPRAGGGYTLRDSQGRRTGTLEPSTGGTWIKRDAQGRRLGTREPR